VEEDYYIPVRGASSGTDISTVQGGGYEGAIEDVKYLRDKLFSALKIPMSYLSRGDGASEDKATLAQKDIRFARTVTRLQRSIVSELEKITIIHLFTLGYRGNDLLSFKLTLNNPSKLAELQELEHWKARFEAADGATATGYFSKRWVSRNILSVNEEEFQRMQSEMFYDKKHDFALEQVGEVAAAEGAGGMGGALGGEMAGGEEMMPEEPAGEVPEAEVPSPEEEPLLATPEAAAVPEEAPGKSPEAAAVPEEAPGKRDEKDKFGRSKTTTARSKGKWYEPTEYDHRTGKRQSFNAAAGKQHTGTSYRSFLPGLSDLYRFSENQDANYYNKQEKEIFQENIEIKKLLDSLKEAENSTDETQT